MDVRIGVQFSAKEIEGELGTAKDEAGAQKEIEKVLADKASVLWVTDKKGRKTGVPAEKITYVEIGAESTDRKMGFVVG